MSTFLVSTHARLNQQWRKFLSTFQSWWKYFKCVNYTLIVGSGPFVRCALGLASYIWAIELFVSNGEVFDRPNYYLLATVTNETILGIAFLIHALGVTWRLYDRRPCTLCGLVINIYGFLLWTAVVASIHWSVSGPVPVAALDIVGCLGAFVSIIVNDVKWWKNITP